MEIYVSSNWKFGVNLMVFRGNGGEIRCCLQSIKESLQIIDCLLTANEGRDNLKNIRELVRDQVNYRDAAKTLQTSLPSPCLRPQEKVNLQDFMKKQKLSNWKTAGRNNVVELHEHRNLFARMIIESLLQQTSQRFRSLKRISFTHQDKDSADRLSNTEDHQGWLAKQGTSNCSRRSEQAKIFLVPQQIGRGKTQRLFYMPWMLQPELRHSLDTEVFILALRHYTSLCKNTPFVAGTARNNREIILQPIFRAIGSEIQVS